MLYQIDFQSKIYRNIKEEEEEKGDKHQEIDSKKYNLYYIASKNKNPAGIPIKSKSKYLTITNCNRAYISTARIHCTVHSDFLIVSNCFPTVPMCIPATASAITSEKPTKKHRRIDQTTFSLLVLLYHCRRDRFRHSVHSNHFIDTYIYFIIVFFHNHFLRTKF